MRCQAKDGPTGYRCTLEAGHKGPHSILPVAVAPGAALMVYQRRLALEQARPTK